MGTEKKHLGVEMTEEKMAPSESRVESDSPEDSGTCLSLELKEDNLSFLSATESMSKRKTSFHACLLLEKFFTTYLRAPFEHIM